MLFNEMLMKRRRELGMTQDDLAEKLDISRQSVSRWENGECMPDSDKLIKLSDVLEISLDELTGREVKVEPIVLEAPVIPKKKRPRWIRAVIAAAVCTAFAAAGILVGRFLIPRNEEGPAPALVSLPDNLLVSGFKTDQIGADGKITCSFVSNTSIEGTVYFYPSYQGSSPVSASTEYKKGMQYFSIRLIPGMTYDKAVFTIGANGEERNAIIVENLSFDAEGGASYSVPLVSGMQLIETDDYTAFLPENGIVVGFDDPEGDKCASECLETIQYSIDDFIVPFDKGETLDQTYAHVCDTYPSLTEEEAMKLAVQITDRIEQINTAILEHDTEGLEYKLTEDGSRIYDIGKVIDGVLNIG